MKRQRGRGRKPGGGGGNPGNRSLESNGPDVKIRGTAAQIYEKYMQYSRDAQSAGDRVKSENYLQHAEHYFRIMAATMPKDRLPQLQDAQSGANGSDDRGEEASVETRGGDSADEDVEASEEADAEDAEAGAEAQPAAERGEGRSRRRRGRRRPGDEADGEQRAERSGGDAEARSALDALARKQGAMAGG
ncbi:MAG: DUF4167 domain-containing protein [Hyphomonadaceae bacterium]